MLELGIYLIFLNLKTGSKFDDESYLKLKLWTWS